MVAKKTPAKTPAKKPAKKAPAKKRGGSPGAGQTKRVQNVIEQTKAVTEDKPPAATGAPRTEMSVLPDDWMKVLEGLANEGATVEEMHLSLGLTYDQWRSLSRNFTDFAQAVSRARDISKQWWIQQARRMVRGGDGNALVWKFCMQNMHGWKERTDVSSEDGSMSPAKNFDPSKMSTEALKEFVEAKRIADNQESASND